MKSVIIWAEDMEELLGTSRLGIYRRVSKGTLPRPLKVCGRVCWRRQDWENWLELEARRQGVAVEAPAVSAEPEPHPKRRRGRPTKEEQAALARRERAEKLGLEL